ncbi:TatD family hydrolase [Methylobacillus flagellatus]|uniref:TatD family hydrolase n=1 Tax=Methylobacillus flagellatus TaxID=405 RepID=UPI0010F59106|nr:TatD family hydrolase [Methylobacillus flagellatus]
MLIDTHCHLDAAEFDDDRDAVVAAALAAGVDLIVVPAVEFANFDTVTALAQRYPRCVHALGIHPMYVGKAQPEHLQQLAARLVEGHAVAVGEIGLDFFVTQHNRAQQEYYFVEQLKLAQRYDLPVILHVRRAVDEVLKFLRRYPVRGGIAHAFNGSQQQAEAFIKLGFKLGFGGAMTYPQALRIRALAQNLPLDSIVLETDAPDIPPAWLGRAGRNVPVELPEIAAVLATLRAIDLAEILATTGSSACFALPKIADLYTPPDASL